jgi:ketol-acid reductoisomerase
VLGEIKDGSFARKWVEENRGNETGNRKWFEAERAKERTHTIEKVGKELRAMMPFLDPVDVEKVEK